MDCRERKGKRERVREREEERDVGMEGGNAFIYIYEIVDDAMRAYVRFEMHKERARGRGINFQWGDKNGRDVRVNIRRTQLGMQNVYKIRGEGKDSVQGRQKVEGEEGDGG